MALQIGKYGDVLSTLSWEVLRTSYLNVLRMLIEDVLRTSVRDITWRYIEDYIGTSIGRPLGTCPGLPWNVGNIGSILPSRKKQTYGKF